MSDNLAGFFADFLGAEGVHLDADDDGTVDVFDEDNMASYVGEDAEGEEQRMHEDERDDVQWGEAIPPFVEVGINKQKETQPVSNQPVAPMPEATFSANFRMMRGAEHLITVRGMTAREFLDSLDELTQELQARGFTMQDVRGAAPQYQPAPQQQRPAQPVQQQQTAPPLSRTQAPQSQQGVPSAGQGNETKVEHIEGYVVGSYNDKRAGHAMPVLFLYPRNYKFAEYRMYPEDAHLLPVPFPTAPVQVFSAPDKARAQASNQFVPCAFDLLVEGDFNDDGTPKFNKGGYRKYRIPKASAPTVNYQQPAAPVQPQQPPVAQQRTGTRPGQAAPAQQPAQPRPAQQGGFPLVAYAAPNTPYDPESIFPSMVDSRYISDDLGIPEPLDEWFIDVRDRLLGPIPAGKTVNRGTDTQLHLLSQWAAEQLGEDYLSTSTITLDIGDVPLGGMVLGFLVDCFAMKGSEVPELVMVAILQRVIQSVRGAANPHYDANFAENLAEVVRIGIDRTVGGGF